jgi:hypothetical protein
VTRLPPDSQTTPSPLTLIPSPARGEGGSRASCASPHSHVPVQQSEPSALRATSFTRPPLRELQQALAAAVYEDDAAVLAYVSEEIFPAARHVQIYRRNTFANLTDALAADYPVVQRLVGEGFFDYAADGYIRHRPPRSGNLHDFGGAFAAFLAEFAPAQSLAYLPDVARLERARQEAYHAADAVPLTAEALAAVPADKYGTLTLSLHPSVRMLASKYPVLAIWKANQPDAQNEITVNLDQGSDRVLVSRPGSIVTMTPLTPGDYELLRAFAESKSLMAANDIAIDADANFDLAQSLHRHIQSGAIAGFRIE